jgi:hypothetical protein
MMFDGMSGEGWNQNLVSFLRSATLQPVDAMAEFSDELVKEQAVLDLYSLKERAQNQIMRAYSKRVRYYGKNNRVYFKNCDPDPSSIFIRDMKLAYIPISEIEINVLNQRYHLKAIENDSDVTYYDSNLFKCYLCGQDIVQNPLLCNSCGHIGHGSASAVSHSYRCNRCGKTLCKDCSHFKRSLLVYTKVLCKECDAENRK